MKATENLSAREMRRRQRQISAYLSELRAVNTDDEQPRRPRLLGSARAKARAARARRATRPA